MSADLPLLMRGACQKLLFEFANHNSIFIQHLYGRKNERHSSPYRQYFLPRGCLDVDFKWSHPLVLGKAKHLSEEAKIFFATVQDNLFCLGIINIKVTCGFEYRRMFFNQKNVLI